MARDGWTLPSDRLDARRRELLAFSAAAEAQPEQNPRRGLRAAIVAGAIAVLAAAAMAPIGANSSVAERIRNAAPDPGGLVLPVR